MTGGKPNKKFTGHLLDVKGLRSDEIAYNPAVIVQRNKNKIERGVKIIAVRVESTNSYWLDPERYDPHIIFFKRENDSLVPIPESPVFYGYEDPFATWIVGENNEPQLLFGGVKLVRNGNRPVRTTRIHLGQSIRELDPECPFAEIRGMRNIRFAQLPEGKLAVFTRPTTGAAYPGRIGLEIIDNLDEIKDPKVLSSAKLLNFEIKSSCKIGVNEAFFVEETGLIKVFCHIATIDGNDFEDETSPIHYSGYTFEVDPKSPFDGYITPRLLVNRSDFPENKGNSKGHRFKDVLFPGGVGGPDQKELYVGLEDARIGVMEY